MLGLFHGAAFARESIRNAGAPMAFGLAHGCETKAAIGADEQCEAEARPDT